MYQAGGVQEKNYDLVCYPASSPPFNWKILILAYLAVFQIVGIETSEISKVERYCICCYNDLHLKPGLCHAGCGHIYS